MSDVTPEIAAQAISGYFPGNLGIEFVSIEGDEVHARMEVDKRHLHPGQVVHGGAWVAFADTVAAWGTMKALGSFERPFTTVELKANVFTAARAGDVLEAVGKPLHVGRRTQAWEVRITKGDKLAAFFACTQMVLD